MFPFTVKEKHYRVFNERRERRVKAPYLMKHRFAGSEEDWRISNLKDLSPGGMKFWTEKFYPEGSLLQVLLWIPPVDCQVKALGRVVRAVQGKSRDIYYISAAFLEISRGDQEVLKNFIHKLSTLQGAKALVDRSEVAERRLPVMSTAQ
ncbi:MAG: PilZ domain-containing protein [Candidatus Omnitrophica bacterium]|nr:PilZ domain-containing protein [Candidatus Omnitrophota bacterium]